MPQELGDGVEPRAGIEPATSCLPSKYSTAELHGQKVCSRPESNRRSPICESFEVTTTRFRFPYSPVILNSPECLFLQYSRNTAADNPPLVELGLLSQAAMSCVSPSVKLNTR